MTGRKAPAPAEEKKPRVVWVEKSRHTGVSASQHQVRCSHPGCDTYTPGTVINLFRRAGAH